MPGSTLLRISSLGFLVSASHRVRFPRAVEIRLKGNIVEEPDRTEPNWRKSSHSSSGGCVEVALGTRERDILVRDSKNRNGPVLRFSPLEWNAFINGVRDGEFELP
jgi:hypothetical protein